MELMNGGSIGGIGMRDEGHIEYYKRVTQTRGMVVEMGRRRSRKMAGNVGKGRSKDRDVGARAGEEVRGIEGECKRWRKRAGMKTDGNQMSCGNGGGKGVSRMGSVACQGLGKAGMGNSPENENQGFFSRQFRYRPRKRTVGNQSDDILAACQAVVGLEGVAEDLRLPESVAEQFCGKLGVSRNGSYTADVHKASSKGSKGVKVKTTDKLIGKYYKRNPVRGIGAMISSESSSSESSCSESNIETRSRAGRKNVRVKQQRPRPLLNENSAVPTHSLQTTPIIQPLSDGAENPLHGFMQNQASSKEIFVCQGKGCTKRGSCNIFAHISELGSQAGIPVSGSKCMKMCGKGPIVAVKSDSELVHYSGVTPSRAIEFVE